VSIRPPYLKGPLAVRPPHEVLGFVTVLGRVVVRSDVRVSTCLALVPLARDSWSEKTTVLERVPQLASIVWGLSALCHEIRTC
jgi:hypothetical protein